MQFIDLKAQYQVLKPEIDTNIRAVLNSAQFIGGSFVKELENKLKEKIGEEKQVVDKHVNIFEKGQFVEVELVYEVLEKIGTKEKIEV